MRNSLKSLNLVFLLAIVLFASCKKEHDKSVQINFINETGKDLSNVIVNEKVIGTLLKDGQTGYIRFDRFGVDTGAPDADFKASVNGSPLDCTSQFYWCGTEKRDLEGGKYEVLVRIISGNGTEYIHLRFP